MYCGKCGALVSAGEKFCGSCGEAVNNSSASQPEQKTTQLRTQQQKAQKAVSDFKPVCLVIILICAVLWLVAPFVAVNLLTVGDQPTALQFITDDILYIGDLADSAAFWAAIGSMIGIIVCFICTLAKKNTATRVMAIITEVPMAFSVVETLNWAGGDVEDVFEIAGFGFWGILLLMLVVIVTSGAGSRKR